MSCGIRREDDGAYFSAAKGRCEGQIPDAGSGASEGGNEVKTGILSLLPLRNLEAENFRFFARSAPWE
jgi:hypothetical protein